jgi:hypothetical protein
MAADLFIRFLPVELCVKQRQQWVSTPKNLCGSSLSPGICTLFSPRMSKGRVEKLLKNGIVVHCK